MITLTKNADKELNELIRRDNVRAFYHSVCEHYTKGYRYTFVTDLQTLVTKIGISVATIAKGPNFSNCSRSISYLCKNVLDSKNLDDQFKTLGINTRGNITKHTINDQKVYMDKCVVAYNSMIDLLINKYKLNCLKDFIIKKDELAKGNVNKRQKVGENKTNENISTPKKKKDKVNSTSSTSDGKIALQVSLLQGDGRFLKGIFDKVEKINFKIKVDIKNPSSLHINKVTAKFTSNGHITEMKLSPKAIITTVELNAKEYNGLIKASVTVEYKLSLFKTKQIKTSVSKRL